MTLFWKIQHEMLKFFEYWIKEYIHSAFNTDLFLIQQTYSARIQTMFVHSFVHRGAFKCQAPASLPYE